MIKETKIPPTAPASKPLRYDEDLKGRDKDREITYQLLSWGKQTGIGKK